MRAHDGQRQRGVARLGLEARDDARLREAVREVLERDVRVEGRGADDLLSFLASPVYMCYTDISLLRLDTGE